MTSACPQSRYGHVSATIDNEMLLWGGLAVSEARGHKFYCSHETIECFDLSTNAWNQRQALSNSPSDVPRPCGDARIAVVQNRDIYQFGGFYASSDGRPVYSSDFHKLDASTLEWQRRIQSDQSACTPVGRMCHGLCVLGRKGDENLVLMGGKGVKILSPIPASQWIPYPRDPDVGLNNEVWMFSLRKRKWIPVECRGRMPSPRYAHSFTAVDVNRAILIGGMSLERTLNDVFLFHIDSVEWIEMKLDNYPFSRFFHSAVVVDISAVGPVALILWGYGANRFPLSQSQLILIDSRKCKEVKMLDEPIPTGRHSMCSVITKGVLFFVRFGGSPYKVGKNIPEALLDILKYDLTNVGSSILRHDLSEPVCKKIDSPIMNCDTLSSMERELLHPTPTRAEDVIAVVTVQSVLIFTRWKEFSTTVSSDKGAEISIPNTRSTLRIHPGEISTPTSIGFDVFTFDAKQSHGVNDDEFVSDLIQLSLPSGDQQPQIAMCHEHGLNLDPATATTSASKVVFFYQPHKPLGKTEHEITFDRPIGIGRIVAHLQSSVVVVSSSSFDNAGCSFFTHFYGLGCRASTFRALAFERVKIPDAWHIDLCVVSTRPEHRERYLAYRNLDRLQPLLLDQSINLLRSPTESNVVKADDVEGWINRSLGKKYFINMQQCLAARDSPIDAWVRSFFFSSCSKGKLLDRLSTTSVSITIASGDRRQCLCIQSSSHSSLKHELALEVNPSHQEIEDLTFLMRSRWRVVARFIVPVFTESEIDEIEAMEREDQPCRFLQAWIRKHRLDATRDALCAALFAADLGSSAQEVFPEIYENMTREALLDPSLQIQREDLVYDEDKDFVGGGACGEVYKASLKKDGEEKSVAVKLFYDFKRRRTENEYDMFKKEATVLLRIKPNPFILSLIGLCAVPRHYALVTEFVSGGSLSSLLKSNEHERAVDQWQTRIAFAKQIAEGMLHLHYNHPCVIHQDLKSQNVLVDVDQRRKEPFICKVADFGLSKMSGISSITTERDGSRPAGTVTHIAPERYSQRPCGDGDESTKKDLARKSDVYSYGVLLWEVREKQHPYQGMRNDLVRLHVMGGGRLPEGLAANVPPFFNEILEQCVKFKPQERPMFRDVLLMLKDCDSQVK